ncbi:protein WALLS ARE THIN 1 [Arachis duranensis]|uniref:WAT1-related protein n=1 Tax=Arachis duranensis TaxID=130453 RepID=A0A9C6U0C3_ARADU|nr:protein WALLS ARE THIN 1 [Arachis duranensis]
MGDSGSSKRMWCSVPEKFQLHGAMLALQFGYAGFHVVSRAALNMGVSKLVFPVYRNIIALLLLLPFAYFLEKLHLITANQGFYLLGLENTSPTFASAIQNSVPAITFLMAAILRIEQVRLNRKDGISKVVGTILCVIGATVITLYKGPTIYSPKPTTTLLLTTRSTLMDPVDEGKNWTLGCIYLIGHCLSWSGWLVLQAPVLKKYPARLSVTSYTCFFGLLQFILIALIFERDYQAWLFHSGAEAFTILYAGVVASGIAFAVQIWCIDRGGPVFVAVYQPVQTFVVAIMASFALGEEFYLGGIIGAVLIVVGLYLVLWGKSEEKRIAQLGMASNNINGDHSIIRASSHAKASSLTQPLILPSSTDNHV